MPTTKAMGLVAMRRYPVSELLGALVYSDHLWIKAVLSVLEYKCLIIGVE